MKRRHFTRIDLKEYDRLKRLINDLKVVGTSKVTGRSTSTLGYIKRSVTFAEYQEFCRKQNEKKPKTVITAEVKAEPIVNGFHKKDSLDLAIEKLDATFEELKSVITEVVVLSSEKKVAEYKKDKEFEIASLRTVVNAAKQNNLASVLKRKLMGG